MSRQTSSRRRAQNAGEYVTNWSAVLAAAGLGLLLVAGLAGALLLDTFQVPPPVAVADMSETAAVETGLEQGRLATKPPHFRRSPPYFSPPPACDVAAITPRRPAAAAVRKLVLSLQSTTDLNVTLRAETLQAIGGAIEHHLTTPPNEPRPATVYTRVDSPPADPTNTGDNKRVQVNDPLLDYLVNDVRELKLDDEKDTSKKLFESTKSTGHQGHEEHAVMLRSLAQQRTDLRGLPLLDGEHCTVDAETATMRTGLSTMLRRNFRIGSDSNARMLSMLRQKYMTDYEGVDQKKVIDELRYGSPFLSDTPEFDDFAIWVGKQLGKGQAAWKDPRQVAIFEQVMQCESPEYRRMLVVWLSQSDSSEATAALARRAVFDLDEGIREKAADALREREAEQYIDVFDKAARYPLATIAQNAREAYSQVRSPRPPTPEVVDAYDSAPEPDHPSALGTKSEEPTESQVEDEAAVWETAALLARNSHVSTPYYKPGCTDRWVVDELVKVNHLRSCVMCHPASHSTEDPLRGQIPSPGEPLPRVYYGSNRGNFVRANVVFIRQDFSAMLPVKDASPWPEMQRFDFFRVTRPATSEEMTSSQAQRVQAGADLRRKMFNAMHEVVAVVARTSSSVLSPAKAR